MKYLVAILTGAVVGAFLFAAGMYFNPFVGRLTVSPLAMSGEQPLDLSFAAAPREAILYTDQGESKIQTHPERVAELWEPTVADTRVFVTVLHDGRGDVAGIGIKYSTDSERTSLFDYQVLVDSSWQIYVPGKGTLFIDQVENLWPYLREIVVPARWSSGDNWRGSFVRFMTQGPLALGTARVTGGAGNFTGETGEAVESLSAQAYAVDGGLVSAEGRLTISLQAATDGSR